MVAIALGLAVEQLIPTVGDHRSFDEHAVPLGVALLTTLIPFYHGALRHLDREYVEETVRNHKSGAVLADFALLFLEGCVFLALGVSIAKPWLFGWIFFTLLVVDCVWALLATRVLMEQSGAGPEPVWLKVNVPSALVLLVMLSGFGDWGQALRWGLLGVALARTALDYGMEWRFYAND